MITRRAWGRVGVGVASALAMVATPLAAQAKPVPTVGCGTVLTSSVVLTRDLVDCPEDGLVVGADGVTVDLGGHSVSGDGVPGTTSVDAGVRVEGRHGVTVVDGSVSGFDRGVALIDSDRIRVAAITASATTRSVIYLTNTTGSVVTANAVTTPNGGIYLTGGSAHNTISHNRAFGSEQGITIDGADDNTVAFNLIDHNSDNMIVVGNRNLITGNVVSHASGCGDDGCGYGISQEGGSGNRIVGNLVSGNLFDGIRISNFFPDAPADANQVTGNVVTGSSRDGIAEGTEGERLTSNTLIVGNLVSRNAGTGIHVSGLSATVTANTALGNGGHGIDAVPGTRDGGRNRAAGNHTAPPCIGVVCGRA